MHIVAEIPIIPPLTIYSYIPIAGVSQETLRNQSCFVDFLSGIQWGMKPAVEFGYYGGVKRTIVT